MMALINYDLPDLILKWVNVFTWASTVILLVYASASAITYLSVQDMFVGTDIGNKMERFTGISGARDREGIKKVYFRIAIAIVLLALVVSNSHLKIFAYIYKVIDTVIRAMI